MKPQRKTGNYLAGAIVSSALSAFSYGLYLATYAASFNRFSAEYERGAGDGWYYLAILLTIIGAACAAIAAKQIGDTIDYRHDLLVDEYEDTYGNPDDESE